MNTMNTYPLCYLITFIYEHIQYVISTYILFIISTFIHEHTSNILYYIYSYPCSVTPVKEKVTNEINYFRQSIGMPKQNLLF